MQESVREEPMSRNQPEPQVDTNGDGLINSDDDVQAYSEPGDPPAESDSSTGKGGFIDWGDPPTTGG